MIVFLFFYFYKVLLTCSLWIVLTNLCSHNDIHQLPDEIGNLVNLTALIGVSNQISKLPMTIKNLTNLKSLHLNGNKLKQIRAEVCKCKSLIDLYLERNQLTDIPEELAQLHHLKHLNIAQYVFPFFIF